MNNPLLHFDSQGQGEPLVILHGLFGSSRNWNSLGKKLADHYHVIRVDLRNHGDSFHSPKMSYPLMAGDLEELLGSLGIESANLLGHSMGGKAAMTFCHSYPERVKKLVVADISPVSYQHDFEALINPLMDLQLEMINNRMDADKELSKAIPQQQIRQFLLQNLEIRQRQASWKVNLPALEDGMDRITGFEDINNWYIQQQSLFIRGANSNYVEDKHWRLIQKHFDKASLHTIEDAGHWLHFEQPEQFYNTVFDFLSG